MASAFQDALELFSFVPEIQKRRAAISGIFFVKGEKYAEIAALKLLMHTPFPRGVLRTDDLRRAK